MLLLLLLCFCPVVARLGTAWQACTTQCRTVPAVAYVGVAARQLIAASTSSRPEVPPTSTSIQNCFCTAASAAAAAVAVATAAAVDTAKLAQLSSSRCLVLVVREANHCIAAQLLILIRLQQHTKYVY